MHSYKYKYSDNKLLNITVCKNMNICKSSMFGQSKFGLRNFVLFLGQLLNSGPVLHLLDH